MINLDCIVCGGQGHDAMSCSRVHYIPDHNQIIKNFIQKEKTFHTKFKRRGISKFHARTDLGQIVEQARLWAQHHPQEVQKILSTDSQIGLFSIKENNKENQKKKDGSIIVSPESPGSSPCSSPKAGKTKEHQAHKKSVNNIKQKGSHSFLTDEEEAAGNDKEVIVRRNKKHKTTFLKSQSQRQIPPTITTQTARFQVNQYSPRSPLLLLEDQHRKTFESSIVGHDIQQRLDQSQALSALFEFDRVHNFTLYFPYNNISTILENMKIQRQKQEELEKAKGAEKGTSPLRKSNSLTAISNKKKGKPFLGLDKAFKNLKSEKNLDILSNKLTLKNQKQSKRPVATPYSQNIGSLAVGSYVPEMLSSHKLE